MRIAKLLTIAGLLLSVSAHAQTPDLILLHGKILTVDANDAIAQALAISKGKIIAVGSDEQIQKLATAATKIIDLHGRTATPGLIDTHAHLADGGIAELYSIPLGDVTTIDEVKRRVQTAAKERKPGEWITGSGWDEGKLTEQTYHFFVARLTSY